VASYCSALAKCLDLAAQSYRGLESECTVKVINALFAPRTLGGWGIPHICGWLTQETPDNLVSYITLMSTFYEVATDSLVKGKIASALEATLRPGASWYLGLEVLLAWMVQAR
jgi:hypothetical protein